ncbi:MAG: 1-(5-phosphoribosyl)-5-[(5-phosphoribosylamino)methylideneamino] imidazole-4-carboxamide isomerase [Nitrososphaerota archaeon]
MRFEIVVSIDIMGGRTVRLERGSPNKPTYYPLAPPEYARIFGGSGCDRLHIVDLDAAFRRGQNIQTIREVIEVSEKLVQVAGGIRSTVKAEEIIGLGAGKIVVSSVVFTDRAETSRMLERIGAHRIIAALDFREGGRITTHGWSHDAGLDLLDALHYVEELGFREIMVTDTSRDGTLLGVSTSPLDRIPEDVRRRTLVAGGVAGEGDIQLLKDMGFGGVVLGKAIYEGRIKLR